MQTIINFLRGSISFTVEGAFPEQFLNLCARQGVLFWGVAWLGNGGVQLTMSARNGRRAKALATQSECRLTLVAERGVPAFVSRFRKRYALLLGLVLSLATVCVLSQFILTVEVTGNQAVPTAELLAQLRRLGLRPGTYGPGVEEAMMAQQLMLRVDDLSWCAINLKGTVAQVLVREGVKKPVLEDEGIRGDVVAQAPGILLHVDVLEGEPQFKEGDTVLPGDVVIAGNSHMEGPLYSTVDLGWRQVKAQGRVYARTWRTLEGQIPLEAAVKSYTGEAQTFWSVEVLGRRLNFYRNTGISFTRYDKITKTWSAQLPDGREMPLSVSRQTVRAYDTSPASVDEAAAEELLRTRLEHALNARLGEDGEVLALRFTTKKVENGLVVTLKAECREEIGKFVPWPASVAP